MDWVEPEEAPRTPGYPYGEEVEVEEDLGPQQVVVTGIFPGLEGVGASLGLEGDQIVLGAEVVVGNRRMVTKGVLPERQEEESMAVEVEPLLLRPALEGPEEVVGVAGNSLLLLTYQEGRGEAMGEEVVGEGVAHPLP